MDDKNVKAKRIKKEQILNNISKYKVNWIQGVEETRVHKLLKQNPLALLPVSIDYNYRRFRDYLCPHHRNQVLMMT
jgi:hypothetical protein